MTMVQTRIQKTRFPFFKCNLLVNTPIIYLRGDEGNSLFSWLSRTSQDNNVLVSFLTSRIREQIVDIIFRVDGPITIVLPSSPRRRRMLATSRSARLRIAITHLELPSEERQVLPSALLTYFVTRNSNKIFILDVQLNDKDIRNFFRCMASGHDPQKDKSYASKPKGLNAQGRLAARISSPRRFIQAPGGESFRGCKDKGLLKAQGPKPLSCNQATCSNDPRGLKSLGDNHAHQSGDNPRGDDSLQYCRVQCGRQFEKLCTLSLSNTFSFVSSSDVPRSKSNLCPNTFKMAWLRAVTLMVQYLQNVCGTAHVPVGKDEQAVHRAENEAVQTTQVKKTVINKGLLNAGDLKPGRNHGIEVNGIQENKEDYEEIKEDYENEPIIDQLEIEDEDQLDIVLEDAQDVLQNGNNGIVGNGVPDVPLLPGNLHGYQAHPPPLDEAPGGPGAPHAPHVQILPAWLLEHQANLANLHVQAQQGPQEIPGPNEEAPLGQGVAQAIQANVLLDPQENQENAELQDEANEDQVAPDNQIEHAQQHDQPAGPHVNENGEQVIGADAPANAPDHAPVHGGGPLPVPQAGQQHPQHAHASGPRNRLIAVVRYVKRKLMRRHHGTAGMYTHGAPREERSPLGLEEAPAFQGGFIVQHHDEDGMEEERSARCFAGCFGFLFRRWSGAAVQEYPLQNEQAPEFEEAVANEEDVQEENDAVEEQMEANEPQIEEINIIQVE